MTKAKIIEQNERMEELQEHVRRLHNSLLYSRKENERLCEVVQLQTKAIDLLTRRGRI